MRSIQWISLLLLLAFACEKEEEKQEDVTLHYDFETNAEGWTGDFADYPSTNNDFYNLEFERTNLPAPLPETEQGLRIAGSNRSDDLFMFIKKKVDNLPPNVDFNVRFDIELASKEPTNAIGIGGPPGESVYLKAGVVLQEPQKEVNTSDFYQMNIDKGNQSQSGTDMQVLGHIGVTDTTSVYTLIERNNTSKPFSFRTNDTGSAWICIGTDSGFEGRTELYYNQIKVTFKEKSN
jgi:hypothetical protein